jgi:hypothetical protein
MMLRLDNSAPLTGELTWGRKKNPSTSGWGLKMKMMN